MSITPPAHMDEMLRIAKDYKMTPEEMEEQRQSWVRGEMGLDRTNALPGYAPPERMPELTQDERLVLMALRNEAPPDVFVPALKRIIDRRVAEILSDESFWRKPIIG